ncbi:hypothetical protein [Pontibacter harenae]|uniref:hypothetical protein n=1 Tax=Pontibacter harenae TaxID=2894083 RepID=UPI001E56B50D|nr:hypothetical protein [Pontibacter harenae]
MNRLFVLCFSLLLSVGAMAQQRPQQTAEERAARMMETYKKELNLTAEQVTKLEEINKQNTAAMVALREDTSLEREQRMGKMRELRETQAKAIKAILTEEQQKKFDALQNNSRQGQGGRSGGQGERARQF